MLDELRAARDSVIAAYEAARIEYMEADAAIEAFNEAYAAEQEDAERTRATSASGADEELCSTFGCARFHAITVGASGFFIKCDDCGAIYTAKS